MKRYIILLGIAFLGTFVSCQVQETDTMTKESDHFVFYATHGDQASSKTVLHEDGSIFWGAGDAIQVFCGNKGSAKFVSSNEEEAAEVEFHGSLDGIPYVSDDEFWAVYPYHEGDTYGGEYVTVTLPAEQTATEGSFDKDLFISIARSSNNHLQFYNVCGGIKFSLSQPGVTRVVFQGNDYEALAGEARVTFDINGHPYVTKVDKGVSRITLTPPDGAYFKPGKDYYMVAFPTVLEQGYTMYIQTDTQRAVRMNDKPVAVKRSIWGQMDLMDQGVSFYDAVPDNQIWYTTNDESLLTKWDSGWDGLFGDAQLISETYEDGRGIMTFDRPLTILGDNSFSRCSNATSFRLPDTIREIGEYAFYSNSQLVSIDLPHELVRIGNSAFAQCSKLSQIVLPSLVESIDKYAFSETNALTEIIIPAKMKTISEDTFFKSGIKRVYFPDGLESIERGAFASCENLSEISFPEGLISIGDYAFSGCKNIDEEIQLSQSLLRLESYAFQSTSIQYIDLPDNLEYLGEYVFSESRIKEMTLPPKITAVPKGLCSQCGSLESVILHQDITKIGEAAFYNCGRLKEIVFPENLGVIGPESFFGCGLIQVVVPNTVVRIGQLAFSQCKRLETITLSSEIESLEGSVLSECIKLSSIVIPDKVVNVDNSALYGCTSLSEVQIGSGVINLGRSAFSNCTSLSSITIPDHVENLGEACFSGSGLVDITLHKGLNMNNSEVFKNCRALHSVTLPKDLTVLPSRCFSGCSSLKELSLPESLTTISSQAFWECTSLETLVIPNSVTSIGDDVFYNCSNLKSIAIPEGVEEVSDALFSGCVRLQAVELPSSIKLIGRYAFSNCKSLETVSMQKSTTWFIDELLNIKEHAFEGCLSLTSITFPQEMNEIGEAAFKGCLKLSNIVFQGKLRSIQLYAFQSCSSLESIDLPSMVNYIGRYAFSESGLKSISLPIGINAVTSNLFNGCQQLEHVVVPSGVTKIETQAFINCTKLQDIKLYPVTPPSLVTDAFSNTNNCALLVPEASVEAYQSADNWSEYASRIEAITE